MPVTYLVYPHGTGWRVHSRGFVWDFAQGAQAVDFANDMAGQFARALGQATRVCFRDDTGEFHEVQGYEAALPYPPPPEVRSGSQPPFLRKA